MSGVVMDGGAVAACRVDQSNARIRPGNLDIIHVQHKRARWCDTPTLGHGVGNVRLGLVVWCVPASIGNQKDKRKRTIIKSEIGPLR